MTVQFSSFENAADADDAYPTDLAPGHKILDGFGGIHPPCLLERPSGAIQFGARGRAEAFAIQKGSVGAKLQFSNIRRNSPTQSVTQMRAIMQLILGGLGCSFLVPVGAHRIG